MRLFTTDATSTARISFSSASEHDSTCGDSRSPAAALGVPAPRWGLWLPSETEAPVPGGAFDLLVKP